MDEGTSATTTAEAPTQPITFHGRMIETYLPTEAQIAVIARMSFVDPNSRDVQKLRVATNRVGMLLAGLMANQDDWDFIEDGMAAREIEWDEVLNIFELIAEAHGLKNRAARRATGKSRARRG